MGTPSFLPGPRSSQARLLFRSLQAPPPLPLCWDTPGLPLQLYAQRFGDSHCHMALLGPPCCQCLQPWLLAVPGLPRSSINPEPTELS